MSHSGASAIVNVVVSLAFGILWVAFGISAIVRRQKLAAQSRQLKSDRESPDYVRPTWNPGGVPITSERAVLAVGIIAIAIGLAIPIVVTHFFG